MVGRPFRAGLSGNPAGRPRKDRQLEVLAKTHTKAAVEALVLALRDRRTRVAAACALLDRGWGKCRTSVELEAKQTTKTVYLLPGDERL